MSPKVYDSYGQEVGSVDLWKCKVYNSYHDEVGWIDVYGCQCKNDFGERIGWVDAFQGRVRNLISGETVGRVDTNTFVVYDKHEQKMGRIAIDIDEIISLNIEKYDPEQIAMVYAGCAAILLLLK
jgi:hypothetical protein